MKYKTYLAFVIQAFVQKTDAGTLVDMISITLVENSAEEALARAKKIVEKPNYRISEVIENFVPKNATA